MVLHIFDICTVPNPKFARIDRHPATIVSSCHDRGEDENGESGDS